MSCRKFSLPKPARHYGYSSSMSSELDKKWDQKLFQTLQRLDAVSHTFCAAKWKQTTLHLQNGMTHSCHHPPAHKVPLEELAVSSDALHNTKFKNEQRQLMREGDRPVECFFCWKAEDASKDTYSDRIIKSSDEWATSNFAELAKQDNPTPSYLEVSFGNVCNMRCMYCSPDISSSIWSEFEKFGAYPVASSNTLEWYTAQGKKPIRPDEPNPYLDAFHDWFPKIVSELKVFRITGGEPLLNANTFKMLDWLADNPQPQLDFAINTNLMVPSESILKTANAMESMVQHRKLRDVRLYTSVDTHGEDAEYVRHGLNYDKLLREAHNFLKAAPNVGLTFIVTHNIFSFQNFELLLADILAMKKAHISYVEPIPRVMMDLTILHSPDFMCSLVGSPEMRESFTHSLKFMKLHAESNAYPWGFNAYERNKAQRLYEVLSAGWKNPERSLEDLKADLKKYLAAYDARKNVDHAKRFPEIARYLSN